MSAPNFVPGQRWISETEANLGLGIVVECSGRQVVLSFPAAGERRTYAMDNAPVGRVCYAVGDEVTSVEEWRMQVTGLEEQDGCILYRGQDEQGQERELLELELSSFVQFSTPEARLFAGQIDHHKRFELRCETFEQMRQQQMSSVNGLLGARVQLLPHQLYIAHETAKRFAPRVLLADEVGLGKTIEAGLIAHQQLVSGRASRVLILVPENLVHQWLVEMLRRFNLHFTILDQGRCEEMEESDNPFETAQLVLCPLSFMVESDSAQQQATACDWDLLLVDEAHHLEWSEEVTSPAYQAVEALARIATGLLLLTATPEQLGLESHFARLRLLDPDRYHSLAKFKEEEENYQAINTLVQDLLAWVETPAESKNLQPEKQQQMLQQLEQYLGSATISPLKDRLASEDQTQSLTQLIDPLISALLDRHGTGRVMFRNTRDNVHGFPERELVSHPLAIPEPIAEILNKPASIEAALSPEIMLGDNWTQQDARVAWLGQWLSENKDLKVLVICAHAKSAIELEEHLRIRVGIQSAVFHEHLDLIARDRSAAYFADLDEGAQVLLCSEIGSEGRNFQFAHHLVLFDLPLNPDLLEQRIGRLDRIGQRENIKIHVPFYQGSSQEVLVQWYHEGVNGFEQTSAVGQALFQKFKTALQLALLETTGIDQLLIDTRKLRVELQLQMQQGRDRLLELNSCNPELAREIVEAVQHQECGTVLFDYMSNVFEQFGVDQEHHGPSSLVLHPGDHMRCEHFPGLPEGGVTITHNRQMALAREDIQFLTWEHPMVVGAMDMVLNEDFGNTAVCTLKLAPLKPGTLLLESVFTLICPAPAGLQLSRYLPLTWVRLLLDNGNRSLGDTLTQEHLNARVKRVNKVTAPQLVRHAQPQLEQMIDYAEQQVKPQQDKIVQQAMEKMQQTQQAELQRLQALAEVNPNIRQQEIELLKEETEGLAHYLRNAQLKLNALRVIVVV